MCGAGVLTEKHSGLDSMVTFMYVSHTEFASACPTSWMSLRPPSCASARNGVATAHKSTRSDNRCRILSVLDLRLFRGGDDAVDMPLAAAAFFRAILSTASQPNSRCLVLIQGLADQIRRVQLCRPGALPQVRGGSGRDGTGGPQGRRRYPGYVPKHLRWRMPMRPRRTLLDKCRADGE